MGRNSPSARKHRALVFLAQLARYKTYGPLVGPKEAHQPNPRWAAPNDASTSSIVASSTGTKGDS